MYRLSLGLFVLSALGGCSKSDDSAPEFDYGAAKAQTAPAGRSQPETKPQVDWVVAVLRERDKNHDGFLDFEEYTNVPDPHFRRVETDVFKLADRNKDGKLSEEELRNMPPEAGFRGMDSNDDETLDFREFYLVELKDMPMKQARRIFQEVDQNKDGKISCEEFLHRPKEIEFYKLDTDGDGRLSQAEFDKGYPQLVQSGRNRERFRMRDINKDGYLNLKEFLYDPADEDFWSMDKDGDGYVSLGEFLASSQGGAEKKTPAQGKSGEKVASKADQGGGTEGKKGSSAANGLSGTFASMDLNHDGKLSLTEFRARRPRQPVDWVPQIFWGRDKNRDGYLDFAEFTDVEDPHWRRMEGDVFKLADRNKDGKLNEGELRNMPREVGYRHLDGNDDGIVDFEEFRAGELSGLSPQQARRVCQAVDQNGDGKISCDEYLHRPREVEFFKLDADCDDRLSFAEYSKGSSTPAAIAAAKSAFEKLDLDHDGYLSLKESLGPSPARK